MFVILEKVPKRIFPHISQFLFWDTRFAASFRHQTRNFIVKPSAHFSQAIFHGIVAKLRIETIEITLGLRDRKRSL